MANYTNMVKSNHDRSEAMLNLSLTTISEMVEDGEKITVAELVRRTGFSRDYFYKNKDVHDNKNSENMALYLAFAVINKLRIS